MLFTKLVGKIIAQFSGFGSVILLTMAVALLAFIFREEGWTGVGVVFKTDMPGVAVKYVSILMLFFTIAGSINHLQKSHEQEFKRIVAGEHGPLLMISLSSVLPGPAGATQLHDGWKNGGNKRYLLLSLTSMMALGMNSLIFRSKLLGGELTFIWIGMALIFLFEVWAVCLLEPWTWSCLTR